VSHGGGNEGRTEYYCFVGTVIFAIESGAMNVMLGAVEDVQSGVVLPVV